MDGPKARGPGERSPTAQAMERRDQGPCSGPAEGERSGSEDSCDAAIRAEVKGKICNFLFGVVDSTARNLARSIRLSKARDVNPILLALEKVEVVCREKNTRPHKWSLSERKRMQLKVKSKEVEEIAPPAPGLGPGSEPLLPCPTPELPKNMPTPPLPSPSPPPPPAPSQEAVEMEVKNGQQASERREPGDSFAPWAPPHRKWPQYHWPSSYDNFKNGRWATDDIPVDLNAINNQDEPWCIMQWPLSPSYATEFNTGFVHTLQKKLVACQKKHPVCGLIEYTQFTHQHCEFVLLKESGPPHP